MSSARERAVRVVETKCRYMDHEEAHGQCIDCLATAIEEAVKAERERCAKLAEDYWPYKISRDDEDRPLGYYDGCHWQGMSIAAALRGEEGESRE